MSYYWARCTKCGGKLAEDMIGRRWCPRCVGREMAKEAIAKINKRL